MQMRAEGSARRSLAHAMGHCCEPAMNQKPVKLANKALAVVANQPVRPYWQVPDGGRKLRGTAVHVGLLKPVRHCKLAAHCANPCTCSSFLSIALVDVDHIVVVEANADKRHRPIGLLHSEHVKPVMREAS